MIDWLRQRFIQEIPDELSVCEFECRLKKCSESHWTKCELRLQGTLPGNRSALMYGRNTHTEIPVSVLATSEYSTG
jgi:hypothetical protein